MRPCVGVKKMADHRSSRRGVRPGAHADGMVFEVAQVLHDAVTGLAVQARPAVGRAPGVPVQSGNTCAFS